MAWWYAALEQPGRADLAARRPSPQRRPSDRPRQPSTTWFAVQDDVIEGAERAGQDRPAVASGSPNQGGDLCASCESEEIWRSEFNALTVGKSGVTWLSGSRTRHRRHWRVSRHRWRCFLIQKTSSACRRTIVGLGSTSLAAAQVKTCRVWKKEDNHLGSQGQSRTLYDVQVWVDLKVPQF